MKTKREAVIDALEHRDVHPVPWYVSLTGRESEKLAAYYGVDDPLPLFESCISGCDVVSAEMTHAGRERYRDYFGVIWNRSGPDKDIGVVEGAVLPEPEIGGIVLPPLLGDYPSAQLYLRRIDTEEGTEHEAVL